MHYKIIYSLRSISILITASKIIYKWKIEINICKCTNYIRRSTNKTTHNSPWARCLKLGAQVKLRGTSRDSIFLKHIPLGNIARGDTLSEVVLFRKY